MLFNHHNMNFNIYKGEDLGSDKVFMGQIIEKNQDVVGGQRMTNQICENFENENNENSDDKSENENDTVSI